MIYKKRWIWGTVLKTLFLIVVCSKAEWFTDRSVSSKSVGLEPNSDGVLLLDIDSLLMSPEKRSLCSGFKQQSRINEFNRNDCGDYDSYTLELIDQSAEESSNIAGMVSVPKQPISELKLQSPKRSYNFWDRGVSAALKNKDMKARVRVCLDSQPATEGEVNESSSTSDMQGQGQDGQLAVLQNCSDEDSFFIELNYQSEPKFPSFTSAVMNGARAVGSNANEFGRKILNSPNHFWKTVVATKLEDFLKGEKKSDDDHTNSMLKLPYDEKKYSASRRNPKADLFKVDLVLTEDMFDGYDEDLELPLDHDSAVPHSTRTSIDADNDEDFWLTLMREEKAENGDESEMGIANDVTTKKTADVINRSAKDKQQQIIDARRAAVEAVEKEREVKRLAAIALKETNEKERVRVLEAKKLAALAAKEAEEKEREAKRVAAVAQKEAEEKEREAKRVAAQAVKEAEEKERVRVLEEKKLAAVAQKEAEEKEREAKRVAAQR